MGQYEPGPSRSSESEVDYEIWLTSVAAKKNKVARCLHLFSNKTYLITISVGSPSCCPNSRTSSLWKSFNGSITRPLARNARTRWVSLWWVLMASALVLTKCEADSIKSGRNVPEQYNKETNSFILNWLTITIWNYMHLYAINWRCKNRTKNIRQL